MLTRLNGERLYPWAERLPNETEHEHAARVAAIRQRKNEDAKRQQERARSARLHARKVATQNLPIPPKLKEKIVRGDLDAGGSDALEHVRDFLASDSCFLLLIGATGTGKTVACADAIAEWDYEPDLEIGSGGTSGHALFLKAQAFAIAMRAHSSNDDVQRKIRTARLLVIDDLGTESDPVALRTALYETVDARLGSSHKRTILTSNLDTSDLIKPSGGARVARIDERTADRLREAATWKFVSRLESLRTGSIPGVDL